MAEALAAHECVVWVALIGFQNFIMEGDSLQIVVAFNHLLTNSLLAAITEDLSTHVFFQANTIAHRITRFSLNISSHFEWLDHPLSFIIDLVVEDVM
ncbi:hypothetical protein DVH24_016731 [Malus domestica]|uniref:RNase H type-1 domain-containing protein n=1 Tax=Malus domestica TaxID=3750 RepID=A0A498HSZ3_MALDO|nr:hypothetical protein DVH24_016731 [Malus domestica]